ncbi:MAG: hypothetical protein HUU22_18175, partial [Phycisphaerae bacterium]|nr:hypothetical protein [Phycisphaerae bacterium]
MSGLPLSTRTVAIAPDGTVGEDLPCRKCGYNLRGLNPDRICPECATPVGRSIRGEYLRFADPDWVETMASGMNWIVTGLFVGFALGCAGGGTVAALAATRGAGVVESEVTMLILSGAGVMGALISLVGYWRVTTPDPSGLVDDEGLNARKLVRIAWATNVFIGPLQHWWQRLLGEVALLPIGLNGLLGLIGTVALFIYARRMALRIPNPSLAKQTRIVMWGMAATLVVGLFVAFLGGMIAAIGARAGPPGPAGVAGLGYMSAPTGPRGGARLQLVQTASGPVFVSIPQSTATDASLAQDDTEDGEYYDDEEEVGPASQDAGDATASTADVAQGSAEPQERPGAPRPPPPMGAGPFGGVPPTGPGTTAGVFGLPPRIGAFFTVMLLTSCVMGLGFAVFGIWSLILLFRYRRELIDVAAQARATWAAP